MSLVKYEGGFEISFYSKEQTSTKKHNAFGKCIVSRIINTFRKPDNLLYSRNKVFFPMILESYFWQLVYRSIGKSMNIKRETARKKLSAEIEQSINPKNRSNSICFTFYYWKYTKEKKSAQKKRIKLQVRNENNGQTNNIKTKRGEGEKR